MAFVDRQHVEITPGTCGGKPRIAGHHVRVQDVVIWTEQGQSPDQIVANIPSITIADVYAALAFYHDHREQIDADIRQEIELAALLKAQAGSSVLDRRRGGDADTDLLSSERERHFGCCRFLAHTGIDVTTTSEAGLLAASDEEQLAHALHAGRILVTRDHDFLVIASRGTQHAGIIYWPPSHERLGDVIQMLTLLWRIETTESMAGRIEFL
jgi:uncharacterized protein (DUF433 family)